MTASLTVTPNQQTLGSGVTFSYTGSMGGSLKIVRPDGALYYRTTLVGSGSIVYVPTLEGSYRAVLLQPRPPRKSLASTTFSMVKASAPAPTPVPTPIPGPLPGMGVVKLFPGLGVNSMAAFVALLNDPSIDAIQMSEPGQTLTLNDWWNINIWCDRRRMRPLELLTVFVADNAQVRWDGRNGAPPAGVGYAGIFALGSCYSGGMYKGLDRVAAGFRFDPMGGAWEAVNYPIGSTGLIVTMWAEEIWWRALPLRNSRSIVSNQQSHMVYVGSGIDDYRLTSGPGHTPRELHFDDMSVFNPDRAMPINGLHIYSENGWYADHVYAKGLTVDKAHWGAIARGGTNLNIDGARISNTDVPVDFTGATGIVQNSQSQASGQPIIGSGMTQVNNLWG